MNKKYPWRQALITGVITGLFALSFFAFLDRFNKKLNWDLNPMTIRGISGIVTLIILSIGIYTGMQSVKKLHNGTLTYQHAIISGTLVAFITGIITAIFTFIYCRYINPGFAAYMLSESKKVMISQGIPMLQIDSNLADLEKQLTTSAQVIQAFVGQLVGGTIISLILGLFTKTRKKE